MATPGPPGDAVVSRGGVQPATGGHEPANLGDILERVLDKGLVIAGDIQVNLLDIELLTIKLRLVVASLETAREVGTGRDGRLEQENRELRARVAEIEKQARPDLALDPGDQAGDPDDR